MNATRRQIVSSLPVYLLFGVVAAPAASGQVAAKTVHVEQALNAPIETKPTSFFWGDYDGDGFDDAFVIAPSGQAQLLRNLGDGTLAETTVEAGLSGFTGLVAPTFASWSDMDLDGDLDLFIGTSIGPSGLFLNEGRGTFIEIAALAGLTHTGADEHGGWLDYDQDGLSDLHVRTRTESLLYRNVGGAAFERVELGLAPTAPSRVGVTPVATAGAAPAIANDPTNTKTPQRAPSGNTAASASTTPTDRSRTISPTTIPQPIVVKGTGTTTNPAAGTGSVLPIGSAPGTLSACAVGIEDQANPGAMGCLQASSQPTLGLLYPLTDKLFVSPIGQVGIGTTSPAAQLHVAGTARITDTLTLAPSSDTALEIASGSIYKGGVLFLHTKGGVGNTGFGRLALTNVTTGFANTASGYRALYSNTTGLQNTAIGYQGLYSNTTGRYNTASGFRSLYSNTIGHVNTASGFKALANNTTGFRNTAIGAFTLFSNQTGAYNAAIGNRALQSNTTGSSNTACGYRALSAITTSSYNTADGSRALRNNTAGANNTAVGSGALYANTTASSNTAVGSKALYANTTGSQNTAVGYRALTTRTTGILNIGIGFKAGYNLTTGSYNIDIGNYGVGGESSTIRIGDGALQTRAFLAGVRGATTGVADGITVLVDSAGQLGTVSSSRRFKEDIRDMGEATERLLALRPVVFRYKPEVQSGERPIEYGLIAEEVAEVFPELVVFDDEGKPFTVKYHLLGTMLLNELQKEHERNEERGRSMDAEITAMSERTEAQDAVIAVLTERLAVLEQRE